MAKKERLDILLVEQKFFPSREKAKKMIMAGLVFVNGQREDKAGTKIEKLAKITVKKDPNPYVSRGGLKLHKAINTFDIDLKEKICMDVGASTGGFTDCMLQHGASKVYSIDVGYGQFDWRLRQDQRVVCLEKTNVRYITKEQVPDTMGFISIDVSFISLSKVLPAVIARMNDKGYIVCLIKPQFEAGREKVGKKGVVKDPATHIEVIERIINVFHNNGLSVIGLSFSPITGPEGNIEYLIYGQNIRDNEIDINIETKEMYSNNVKELVSNAHRNLYGK